eukprot:749605-Pelagomonas_calceolata.AAC.2
MDGPEMHEMVRQVCSNEHRQEREDVQAATMRRQSGGRSAKVVHGGGDVGTVGGGNSMRQPASTSLFPVICPLQTRWLKRAGVIEKACGAEAFPH